MAIKFRMEKQVRTKKIQIKDLEPGMKIKTKNAQGEIVFNTVTDVWNTSVPSQDQVRLEFHNGVVLNCSINHPVMCLAHTGEFIQKLPAELLPSDRVLTETGFTSLLNMAVGQNHDETYIDITVADTHTFFASHQQQGPMVLTHNSQGGIRNASATVFYQIWHYQFSDLIVIKNNQGTEETRVRHMDYGVVLSAFFWRRFKNQENITFFDPNEVPDLYEAFYRDTALFEQLYVKYEKQAGLRKKTMSAEEVFKGGILKERTDTGRIYLVNIDNVQNQGPFDPEYHTIYQSNLCCVTGDALIDIQHQGQPQTLTLAEFVNHWHQGAYTEVTVKSHDGRDVVWNTVTAAQLTKHVQELCEIRTAQGHTVRCTPDHEIYTVNRSWIQAQDLVQTDQLLNHAGPITVTRMTLSDPEPVYDITVQDTHAFFANDILVHNCEILLPTKPFKSLDDDQGRIALCTLGSINWGAFRHPEDIRRACRILTRSLNNILDYQDFLSIQSKLSNDEIRPLGIGITNLAYWHAKRGLKYGEEDALREVKSWMEHQAYYLTEVTVELAQERGKCLDSDRTWYGRGVFPWERRARGVNALADFTPELDWEPLREKMKQHGVRNATLMAVAPVESSSVVINSTNGIEMPMGLISTKESKAGSFTQVVPEYHRLKNKYQLLWDQTDCVNYLKTAAVLQAYIDQSISTNTFYSPKHFPDRKVPSTLISKNLMQAHAWGIKSFYYSLVDKQGSKVQDEPVSAPLEDIDFDDQDDCLACKL